MAEYDAMDDWKGKMKTRFLTVEVVVVHNDVTADWGDGVGWGWGGGGVVRKEYRPWKFDKKFKFILMHINLVNILGGYVKMITM